MSVPPPCYRSGTLNYPGHSAKSAGGRLHLNTHTPLTQRSRSGLTMPLSRHNEGTSGNELTRILSGNTRPQSSQLAEPLWTDPGTTSVSTLKKKKKRRREINGRTSSPNPRKRGKSHHHLKTKQPRVSSDRHAQTPGFHCMPIGFRNTEKKVDPSRP